MEREIYKPIFIIGSARSGTTVFHRMLSRHPDLAWFSSISNEFPMRPQLAILSNVLEVPILGRFLRKFAHTMWIIPKPEEAYDLWCYFCGEGFRVPRHLENLPFPPGEDEVTEGVRDSVRDVVRSHLLWQGKPRFMTKYVGFSRIRYLNSIFPDALFIHVVRDGRAVASSLQNIIPKEGWRDTRQDLWERVWPERWVSNLESHNRSPLISAAYTWKYCVQEIRESKEAIDKKRFLEVRYEDLSARKMDVMRGVLDFCELNWGKRFEMQTRSVTLQNRNYKWKRSLNFDDRQALESVLGDLLDQLGYL